MSCTKRVLCVLALCAAWLAPVSAQETFTHAESGLSFTLPAGWTYTHEGDHFEASAPDEGLSLLFFVGWGDEVEEVLEGAIDDLASVMDEASITTDPSEEEINGLLQSFVEGDGLVDGVRVDWDLTVVTGGRRTMAVVAIGDIEGRQGVIDRIYRSIRRN